MSFVEVTAPVESAVNLSELKAHLRLTDTSEDALVAIYLNAATNLIEAKTRRALITRTFRYECDEFPADGVIRIPVSPLVSVQSIEYYDTVDALQTLSSTIYNTDATSLIGRIVKATGKSFPPTRSSKPGAVRVNFTAGYGATPDLVPQGLRFAVMLVAAHFFTNRLPVGSGTMNDIPKTLQYAVDVYKIWGA